MLNIKRFFRGLGPGVVTGAADDDPSGIATYSQTGAQFGYGQLWTAVFMLPFLITVQEICARIGVVKKQGLAAVIKENYNKKVLYFIVMLTMLANIINIGADLGAMAAAAQLMVPGNFLLLSLLFTVIILLLEVFVNYHNYAKILKWLALFLLAYPISLCLIKVPWLTVVKTTFIPHIEMNYQFLFIITGVFGTTITPYLFFWQASQVVEEGNARKRHHKPAKMAYVLHKARLDNAVGMVFSEFCTWSIIVVTATVLHAKGVTNINTAADAAKALEPFAGKLATIVFAIGIIGLGMLAVPVLAGASAYALSEARGWNEGLNKKFAHARGFYGIIIVSTLVGLIINFIGINPMKFLVISAVINGIIAVPLLFMLALISGNEKIMGDDKNGWLSSLLIWLTFLFMAVTTIAMLFNSK
jgi:NRAMP (natural resistance-associated macrophage protein)-like metal ion transporter